MKQISSLVRSRILNSNRKTSRPIIFPILQSVARPNIRSLAQHRTNRLTSVRNGETNRLTFRRSNRGLNRFNLTITLRSHSPRGLPNPSVRVRIARGKSTFRVHDQRLLSYRRQFTKVNEKFLRHRASFTTRRRSNRFKLNNIEDHLPSRPSTPSRRSTIDNNARFARFINSRRSTNTLHPRVPRSNRRFVNFLQDRRHNQLIRGRRPHVTRRNLSSLSSLLSPSKRILRRHIQVRIRIMHLKSSPSLHPNNLRIRRGTFNIFITRRRILNSNRKQSRRRILISRTSTNNCHLT